MADPATLLFTDAVREEMPGHVAPLFVEDELLLDDFNKWVELANGPVRANALELAAGGDLGVSHRFRAILEPLGLGDELRASLLDGETCWGFLCLHRALGERSFSREEADSLASLAPVMANGLRRSLLQQAAAAGAEQFGVVLLADDLTLIGMSGPAERWLAEISDQEWPTRHELPPVLVGVAARLQNLDRESNLSATARIQTASGIWLVVQASKLSSAASGQTAVILGPAAQTELAPLIMRAYSFTSRESDVARLVLSGLSTKEIAARLRISELTVQQHLKSIFDKTGVRNRRQLAAQIFSSQYEPRIKAGQNVGASGQFTD